MFSNDPIDGRGGASQALIDLLKSADRVLVGLKDRQTAIVQLGIGDEVRYVVLAATTHSVPGATLAAERPLAILDAQRDLFWHNALEAVRAGDQITIGWSLGWAQVTLGRSRPVAASPAWKAPAYRRWMV